MTTLEEWIFDNIPKRDQRQICNYGGDYYSQMAVHRSSSAFHFWRKVCAAFYSSFFFFFFFASLLLLPFSSLCPFNKEHYILRLWSSQQGSYKRRHATPTPRHAKLRRHRRAMRTATRDAVITAPSQTTPLRNEACMARYKNNIY
jgi:hypothetical protein